MCTYFWKKETSLSFLATFEDKFQSSSDLFEELKKYEAQLKFLKIQTTERHLYWFSNVAWRFEII